MTAVLEAKYLVKNYKLGRSVTVQALRGMDMRIERGEFVSIVGPSGSGKTTLLNVIGLLDHPDEGDVLIDGSPTAKLAEKERAKIRRDKIGFIFQTFNLLPHLTAEENVAMPLRYADSGQARYAPADLLDRVGLGERLGHRPDELSGGEQQRVAIARALLLDPPIILADEPTGDLDSETAEGISQLLRSLHSEGKSLIVVTHNDELAAQAERTIRVRDGHILQDEDRSGSDDASVDAPSRRAGTTKRATSGKRTAGTKRATSGKRTAAKRPAPTKRAATSRTSPKRTAAKSAGDDKPRRSSATSKSPAPKAAKRATPKASKQPASRKKR